MKRPILIVFAAVFAIGAADAREPAWVQFADGGAAEVRVLAVPGQPCPDLTIDAHATTMTVRAAGTTDFPRTVCSLTLPGGAKSVLLGSDPLPLPVADPQRILVLGDTGCRIKGEALQSCNDPKKWPFPQLAAAAAAQHPDLVLHLGDYLYRESPCPVTFPGCKGSPWGDNWVSWDADVFTPAAPLLAAAPWIIVRGNHEDCHRAGPGFLRLLGPGAFDPAAPCTVHLSPYSVSVGGQTIAITDSSSADDQSAPPDNVALYAKDFATVSAMAVPGRDLWLASHRPIWGVITYMGLAAGGNATMIAAAGDLSPLEPIALMLSGHIHTFEAIDYDDAKVPPQIVAGHGGDNLDVTPLNLRGTIFQGHSGVGVKSGQSVRGFGFLMLTREAGTPGWTIALFDSDGRPIKQCHFANRAIACPGMK